MNLYLISGVFIIYAVHMLFVISSIRPAKPGIAAELGLASSPKLKKGMSTESNLMSDQTRSWNFVLLGEDVHAISVSGGIGSYPGFVA